ncbi:MAG: threonine aldolase family protein, partial [Rhodospirillales bacterium]
RRRSKPLNFASDNTTGAAPEILEAIVAANDGRLMPYGDDELTRAAEARIAEVFETDAHVFLVATGTAANALALSAMTPAWGAVLCHGGAHIVDSECGAPEFFTGGAKLVTLPGDHGRISAADLDAAAAGFSAARVHQVQAKCVSVTQATEVGTCYGPDEVRAIAEVCERHGLGLHMDGARFANAVAALGCSPAELTWKAGVRALSFGATKNGALTAEAVVLFDSDLARDFAFRRKRGGHLFSKMRLLAAQWTAYLTGELWLRNAGHANAMAARLAAGLKAIDGAELTHPVEANILFPRLPRPVIEGLKAEGFKFYERGGDDVVRLVCAFSTTEQDVDALLDAARRHA